MRRLRNLEGIMFPGATATMQMCLDYLYIEPPWWPVLRSLGVDPVRDGIDQFGALIARNLAEAYRP